MLEGYAERLLQPVSALIPRRPRLLKPPRAAAVEQPKGEAAVKAGVTAVAKDREEGAGARLGLEGLGLEEADLE